MMSESVKNHGPCAHCGRPVNSAYPWWTGNPEKPGARPLHEECRWQYEEAPAAIEPMLYDVERVSEYHKARLAAEEVLAKQAREGKWQILPAAKEQSLFDGLALEASKLSLRDGDTLVVRYDPDRVTPADRIALEEAMKLVADNCKMPGIWIVMPDTITMATISPDEMRKLGWVREVESAPAADNPFYTREPEAGA